MSKPWPTVSLGELIRLERRPVKVVADHKYEEIGIYCFGRGVFHKTPRTGIEVGDKDLYELREGDLILQVTFAWEGAIALCGKAEEGLYGSTRYPTFRVNEERCFAPFLVRYLGTQNGLDQINRICPGSAGRNRVLSIKRIPEVMVPLPPLPEQRRIVTRIEELFAKIADARSLRQLAVQEVEALSKTSLSAMSEAFRLQCAPLGKTIGKDALRNGKSVRPVEAVEGVRCLTLSAMRRGRIDMTRTKAVPLSPSDAEAYLVRKDDVFIVRGNGSKHLCGLAARVENDVAEVIYPDLFIRVSLPADRLLPEFFVAAWNSSEVRRLIEDKAKTTSGIWKINQGHILSTPIPLPPLPEQCEIVTELEGHQRRIDGLKRLQAQTAAELDALLPAILDRAFKGEL